MYNSEMPKGMHRVKWEIIEYRSHGLSDSTCIYLLSAWYNTRFRYWCSSLPVCGVRVVYAGLSVPVPIIRIPHPLE